MLLVPPVDLQTYYSLTCWLVDSLTLKKIGVKIPNSHEVVGGGDDVAAPESVVGIRELWCGGFLYVSNSFCTISKL